MTWFRLLGIYEEENQLDDTQYFIALVIGSTCFGHHYAHRQELATNYHMCRLTPWLLVVGGQVQGGWLSVRVEDCCSSPQPEHSATDDVHSGARNMLSLL
jgi:hypothetical protein